MSLDQAPIAGTLAPHGAVPVIDLPAADATRRIGAACRDWGFFQVTGHGVDPGLLADALAQSHGFFALPREAKRRYLRSRDNPWGYYDRELTKNTRDKKEVFDIGPDAEAAPGRDVFVGRTPWPAAPADFEPALRAYFAACEKIAARLLEAISASLGAAPDELRRAFAPAHTSHLRLNHYPVRDPLEDEAEDQAGLGVHHHTDAGALTVLLQDRVSGLQVYRDGAWYTIEPLEGAVVINIGDMVQVWSNDRYRAPLHRVLAMENVDRYSLPFFYNPSYEAVVAPLAEVLEGDERPHYSPISWGEFRRRRADGDFADYGAEVQISDYRL